METSGRTVIFPDDSETRKSIRYIKSCNFREPAGMKPSEVLFEHAYLAGLLTHNRSFSAPQFGHGDRNLYEERIQILGDYIDNFLFCKLR